MKYKKGDVLVADDGSGTMVILGISKYDDECYDMVQTDVNGTTQKFDNLRIEWFDRQKWTLQTKLHKVLA